MSSPKHPRKSRSSHVSIDAYNREKRERNIQHEIRLTEKKMDKLIKRNLMGKMRTPAHRKIWNDSHKEVIKVLEISRKQGIVKDSKGYNRLSDHLNYLRKQLKDKQ